MRVLFPETRRHLTPVRHRYEEEDSLLHLAVRNKAPEAVVDTLLGLGIERVRRSSFTLVLFSLRVIRHLPALQMAVNAAGLTAAEINTSFCLGGRRYPKLYDEDAGETSVVCSIQ